MLSISTCLPDLQERYSFVDLDPASARKAARTKMAAVENGQPNSVPEVNTTGPKAKPDAAIMVGVKKWSRGCRC